MYTCLQQTGEYCTENFGAGNFCFSKKTKPLSSSSSFVSIFSLSLSLFLSLSSLLFFSSYSLLITFFYISFLSLHLCISLSALNLFFTLCFSFSLSLLPHASFQKYGSSLSFLFLFSSLSLALSLSFSFDFKGLNSLVTLHTDCIIREKTERDSGINMSSGIRRRMRCNTGIVQ